MPRGKTEPIGTRRVRNGYVVVKLGRGHPFANSSGWQYENRLRVMEQLGRPLLETERVLHRNGDRFDNRIENLVVVDAAGPPPPHCPSCSCS